MLLGSCRLVGPAERLSFILLSERTLAGIKNVAVAHSGEKPRVLKT